MRSLTTIIVQGEEQSAWEVYEDDSAGKTFGFIFEEDSAVRVEHMLKASREIPEEVFGEWDSAREAADWCVTQPDPFAVFKQMVVANLEADELGFTKELIDCFQWTPSPKS